MTTSLSQTLFTNLFQFPKVRSKYLDAPLLEQRTEYMSHLLRLGLSRQRVKSIAAMLLNVIELLDMKQPRLIHAREVQEAGSKWVADKELRKCSIPSSLSSYNFIHIATKWLTFSALYLKPEAPKLPFDSLVTPYLEELRFNSLLESTISQRRYHLSKFQEWLAGRLNNFAEISLNEIDEYVDSRRAKGWGQGTLRQTCYAIRLFLRFCESRNSCKTGIARGILMPSRIKPETGPRGPAWRDVKRMLRVVGTIPVELRANAIINLCSIYALRRIEVVQLRLTDFDWYNEVMTVQRAKRGRVQQFPIQYQVGEAILAYLKSARPRSSCPNLFTTFRVPIRPMGATCVQSVVTKRMRGLGIKSRNFGSHALRHSCATQLLDSGFSLNEIADFLGHRGLRAVSTYAKYNPRLLRSVASFSLAAVR
jgi:integrase/recombinase XerD